MPDMKKRRSKPATVIEINTQMREPAPFNPEKPNLAKKYSVGDGLIISVSRHGQRRWIARVRELSGRRRDVPLGPVADVTLADAREIARQLRATARNGEPILTKRERRRAIHKIPTFKEAAKKFFETNKHEWTNGKHVDQWIKTLEIYAYPKIGEMAVNVIEVEHIYETLLPIWNLKPETAKRVRQRIAKVLDWCLALKERQTQISQSALTTLLRKQVRKRTHFRALPYAEVSDLVSTIERNSATSNQALLALILTATRSGEVRFAVRSEFDFAAKVWTIPPERMKSQKNKEMGEAHVIPLSDFAVGVFKAAFAASPHKELVFPGMGNKPMSDATMTKALRVAGYSADRATVHGMRSAFRDWVAEKMPHIPDPVAEAALAHQVSNDVMKAYKHTKFLDMRREVMDAWADYCLQREPAALKVVA